MKLKKPATISLAVVLVIVVIAGIAFALTRSKESGESGTQKAGFNEPVNLIELIDRPYVTLTPRSDGREVTLTIEKLGLSANELEYELEYQAGTLLQGAFGSIDFSKEPPPVSKDILLGSCSAGGKCSYHENVIGGTLLMRFRGKDDFNLKTEWRFQETLEAKGQFSSRDSKFQLDAGKTLDGSSIVIIMQTSGLPGDAPGEVISGPYGVFPSKSLPSSGQAELTMRLSQEVESATIYGWTGSRWTDFDTTLDGKAATATVDLLEVYTVVSDQTSSEE